MKHRTLGHTNLYSAVVSQEELKRKSLKSLMTRFFNGSVTGLVNALLKDEKLSDEEIQELLDLVENKKNIK